LVLPIALYAASAAWIGLYGLALGGANLAYTLLAPVLPVAIVCLLNRSKPAKTADAPEGA
jgi:hypothetical protein